MTNKLKLNTLARYFFYCFAGLSVIIFGNKFNESKAQSSSSATLTLPTSGTCSFLVTLPIPLGVNVTNLGETGYNFLGQITFINSTQAVLNGAVGNVIFQTNNSPTVASPVLLKNIPVAISSMTSENGFLGGYVLNVSGVAQENFNFNINAVPANSGKTLLLQMAGPSMGPGSGVCQF